jgi:FkbM family methyltransferase
MPNPRKLIKAVLRRAGLEVTRYEPRPHPLILHRIDLLFDVGANTGQYVRDIREAGYRNRVVSFEPLPEAHAALEARAARDPGWQVHARSALGAATGETSINVAGNSASSSLLPMLPSHAEAAPQSAYVGTVSTPVATLDSVFHAYRRPGERVFLKIDTQGFEAEVLKGAHASLPEMQGVQLELSTVPLYAGQALYDHFVDFFRDRGFVLWSVIPGFVDPRTAQMLQFDAIFFRDAPP